MRSNSEFSEMQELWSIMVISTCFGVVDGFSLGSSVSKEGLPWKNDDDSKEHNYWVLSYPACLKSFKLFQYKQKSHIYLPQFLSFVNSTYPTRK